MKKITIPDSIRTLVVLGDPHGDLAGVKEVFRVEEGAETFFCCVGDVVGYADGRASSRLCRFLIEKNTPTVEGNHEHWVSPRGKLAVFEGEDSQLGEEALHWIKSLPKFICLARSNGDPFAILAHSIRRGGWDWIDEDNAPRFVEQVGSPPVVLVGHSHRPKFISIEARGRANRQSFDFRRFDSLERPVPENGTLLIDAGSIGRPDATEVGGSSSRHDAGRFGTYAVLDVSTGLASLKRVSKSPVSGAAS